MTTKKIEQRLLPSFGERLQELRAYTLKDLNITNRVFNYWKVSQVLTWFPRNVTAKFNFIEACWLVIMDQMRLLGLPIVAMSKLTQQLVLQAFEENLAAEILPGGNDNPVSALLRREISFFSQMVKRALTEKIKTGIITDQDFNSWIFVEGDLLELKKRTALLSQTHFIVPINPIIKKLFIVEIRKQSFNIPLAHENEELVLTTLKRNDVEAIRIVVGNNSKQYNLQDKSESGIVNLAEMLLSETVDSYDSLMVKTVGSKRFVSL